MAKRIFLICILFLYSETGLPELHAQVFSQINTSLPCGMNTNIEFADINNDHFPDIIITSGSPSAAYTKIFLNNGNGTFTEMNAAITGMVSVSPESFAWGDYNNDGWLDFFIFGCGTGYANLSTFYTNHRGESFSGTDGPYITRQLAGSSCWADFDNDGDLDLFFTGYSYNAGILRNDGNETFVYCTVDIVPISQGSVSCADYDKDGDVDILLAGWDQHGGSTRLYRNDGSFVFHDVQANLTGVFEGAARWGDYDADGNLDIIIAGWGGGYGTIAPITKIYHHDGKGNFTPVQTTIDGAANSAVLWGDFDNDGLLDIALQGRQDNSYDLCTIYHNNGDSTFTNLDPGFSAGESAGLALADYDNDGDLDVVSTVWSFIYRNESTHGNTRPVAPSALGAVCLQGSTNSSIVELYWNRGSDVETPTPGLSYNIRIGTTPGGIEIQSPLADSVSGDRWVVQMGNVSQDTCWHINNLKHGRYYWSVQTLDNCFTGSVFSNESFFDVPNHAPVILTHPDTATTELFSYSYKVTTADFDGDSIIYSIVTNASFLAIDSITGLVTGHPGAYTSGDYDITIIARDRYQGIAQQTFQLHVKPGRPYDYHLDQNYPNPFNPSTVIKYQIPIDAKISIKIYNVTGQVVKTLVDGYQSPGFKMMEWNGRNDANVLVASGIYFCVLTCNVPTNIAPRNVYYYQMKGVKQIRKMVLLR
jgi:hypothetical protein